MPGTDKRDLASDAIAAMEARRIWLPMADATFPKGEVEWEIVRFTEPTRAQAKLDAG